MSDSQPTRRPIKTRSAGWAKAIASKLTALGIRPNTISIASVIAAIAGGVCLVLSHNQQPLIKGILYVTAAVMIQMRLLCNLFDGMVAVEGGFKTKSGEIFNDMPDRIADPVLLICVGYAVERYEIATTLGWAAGLLAVMTAYVRVLAGACGAPQRFAGPMAKQHRMAILTVTLIVATISIHWQQQDHILVASLAVITIGCIVTVLRRAAFAIKDLESA
ncbi:MAG: CDP-alcohol phosphatidyltransferase family protein [Phycisphaeraceae bacterium JB051]